MERTVGPPEAEFGAVAGGGLGGRYVPVAGIMAESEFLNRCRVVLLKDPEHEPAVGGLVPVIGHLLPTQVPIRKQPVRVACDEEQPAGAITFRQLPEMLLVEDLFGRRRFGRCEV